MLAVLVLAVLGMGAGWYVWSRADKNFYAAALKEFDHAEEARKGEDFGAARHALEIAEAKLQRVLDEDPTNGPALVLRYKVLMMLYGIVLTEEQKQGLTGDDRPSQDLARRAGETLAKALADAHDAEAQGIALSNCFARDDMRLGQPFAERVVDNVEQKDFPNYAGYQTGSALRPGVEPSPGQLAATRGCAPPPDRVSQAREPAALAGAGSGSAGAETEVRARQAHFRRLKPAAVEEHEADGGRPGICLPSWPKGWNVSTMKWILCPSCSMSRPPIAAVCWTSSRLAIEQAPDAKEVLERVALATGLYERCLALDKAREDLLTEVAIRIALLPALLAKLPPNRAPKLEELAGVYRQIEQLALKAVELNPQSAPALCLELARLARRDGQLKTTLQFANKGLEAAVVRKLPAEDQTVLALHAEAAWALVCQGVASDERSKHLEVLRKNFRSLTDAKGQLIEGYLALFDGRLDAALRKLETAQKDPAFKDTLYPSLGLAYGYMAVGAYDKASRIPREAAVAAQGLSAVAGGRARPRQTALARPARSDTRPVPLLSQAGSAGEGSGDLQGIATAQSGAPNRCGRSH